jgi:hypothetical protein
MVFRAPFGRDNSALMFLCDLRITDWGRGFKPSKAAKRGCFFAGSGKGERNHKGGISKTQSCWSYPVLQRLMCRGECYDRFERIFCSRGGDHHVGPAALLVVTEGGGCWWVWGNPVRVRVRCFMGIWGFWAGESEAALASHGGRNDRRLGLVVVSGDAVFRVVDGDRYDRSAAAAGRHRRLLSA